MHLFVLYLHPLLEKLKEICNDSLEMVTAYADDISIIIIDEGKIQLIHQAFVELEQCAGAKLNKSKTTAIFLGNTSMDVLPTPSWLIVNESVKILGIIFFNSLRRTVENNWRKLIRKTSQLMWLFKPRLLSIHQKVTLVNTFITSKLCYMASILSIPNGIAARITSQIGQTQITLPNTSFNGTKAA